MGMIATRIPIAHTAANLARPESRTAWMWRGRGAREAGSATIVIGSTNPSTCADPSDRYEVPGSPLMIPRIGFSVDLNLGKYGPVGYGLVDVPTLPFVEMAVRVSGAAGSGRSPPRGAPRP